MSSRDIPVAPNPEVQPLLRQFCLSLVDTFEKLKKITTTERANVDKTLSKAARLELISTADPADTPFTVEAIDDIKTECVYEINQRLIKSGKIVEDLVESQRLIFDHYHSLRLSCRNLDWSESTDEPMVLGTPRQKPLDYYLQEGYRLAYQLNGLITRIRVIYQAVDIDSVPSIMRFRDCLKVPEELDQYLSEVLCYVQFIIK
ncbi:uncharacterized protein LOC129748257 [Uranotaenia lowii]|uniref:uncharacterized protein LOC129748257 n=1 Tax=Uranotaenia lowii TaxID=190385 RepID=UPI00247A7ABB|nr:uncharacterized protein LOC129748257 [Uranotaenia lowii]